MRVYIIENEDGEWDEIESTPWKESLRRCPKVVDGMVEIDKIKYVVDPSKMRREKYSPKWVKAIAFLVFLGAGIAYSFRQVTVSYGLVFVGFVVVVAMRVIKSEMQIQLWYRNNPDPLPFFSGHPLPNGITGDMIARYGKETHIEKFMSPEETNWYAIIAVLAVLGFVGALAVIYFQR